MGAAAPAAGARLHPLPPRGGEPAPAGGTHPRRSARHCRGGPPPTCCSVRRTKRRLGCTPPCSPAAPPPAAAPPAKLSTGPNARPATARTAQANRAATRPCLPRSGCCPLPHPTPPRRTVPPACRKSSPTASPGLSPSAPCPTTPPCSPPASRTPRPSASSSTTSAGNSCAEHSPAAPERG